jgi:hypothetical protein
MQPCLLQQIQGGQQIELMEKELEPGNGARQPRVPSSKSSSIRNLDLLASLNLLEIRSGNKTAFVSTVSHLPSRDELQAPWMLVDAMRSAAVGILAIPSIVFIRNMSTPSTLNPPSSSTDKVMSPVIFAVQDMIHQTIFLRMVPNAPDSGLIGPAVQDTAAGRASPGSGLVFGVQAE